MPSRISWIVPNKLIYLQLLDFVTPEEIIRYTTELVQLVGDSHPANVHVIVDFSTIAYLTTDLRFLAQVSRPLADLPNIGHILIFGTKLPLMATLATLVAQLAKIQYQHVQSVEEAVAYLKQVDADMKWMA